MQAETSIIGSLNFIFLQILNLIFVFFVILVESEINILNVNLNF